MQGFLSCIDIVFCVGSFNRTWPDTLGQVTQHSSAQPWEPVNLLIHSIYVSAVWHSRQYIPIRGVAKALWNRSHTCRVMMWIDLLPAGKLEVFFASALKQRQVLQSLSSANKPVVSSGMCKSWLGKERVRTMHPQLIGSSYLASYKYSWAVGSIFQKHKKFCFVRVAVVHILQRHQKESGLAWFLRAELFTWKACEIKSLLYNQKTLSNVMKQNAFTECISHSCILSLYPISFNLIAWCGHQTNLQAF